MNHPKIKILYIIDTMAFGGAQRQLLELIKGLSRYDQYEPSLCFYYLKQFDFEKEVESLKIPLYKIDKSRKNPIRFIVSLIKLIRTVNPNIIHTYLVSPNFWGRLASILARVPIIITSERVCNPHKPKSEIFTNIILNQFTDMIIVNSSLTENFIKKSEKIPFTKIVTIHNGIDLQKLENLTSNNFKIKYSIPEQSLIMGVVGRLVEQKGHEYLFKALSELKRQDWKLLIIGKGILKGKLLFLSNKLGISQNLIWIGTSNEILSLMNDIDLLILPSLWEGFPNVILEAMASGKPVIATDVGENNILVANNKTGLLIQPKNILELKKAIEFYLSNDQLIIKHGMEGKKLVSKTYAVEAMVDKTISIYETLFKMKCE